MQKSTFTDLLFPRFCLYCKKLISPDMPSTYLCTTCAILIPSNVVSRCAFCPKAVTLWKTCREHSDNALDTLLVASDYRDQVVERMVKALKYRFVQIVAHDIGNIMTKYFEQRASLIRVDPSTLTLASIPLHPRRLRWRGFNQAELIAHVIGKNLDLPVRHDLLKRTIYKTPQADIKDRDERIKNAENIFELAVTPPSGTILLIDDVATTASTLNDAARKLKDAGCTRIIGFVFARG